MLKIDGKDFTSCVNRNGVTESQRRVTGQNSGTAIDGSYIEDLVAIKTDVTFAIRPLRTEKIADLIEAISKPYVAIEYESGLYNKTKRMVVVPASSSVQLLTHYAQRAVYGNAEITFREK